MYHDITDTLKQAVGGHIGYDSGKSFSTFVFLTIPKTAYSLLNITVEIIVNSNLSTLDTIIIGYLVLYTTYCMFYVS